MFRPVPFVAVVATAVSLLQPVLHACGDKFLMVGRGARFQRAYASLYPGRLVIYAPASAKSVMADARFHKLLRQAGHNVEVVESWPALEQAMKAGTPDVVLVDVAEAPRVQPLLSSSAAHPDALFVQSAGKPRPAAVSDAVARLKSDDRAIKYLDEIESTMKARSKHLKAS
jgi:hypothetical protein